MNTGINITSNGLSFLYILFITVLALIIGFGLAAKLDNIKKEITILDNIKKEITIMKEKIEEVDLIEKSNYLISISPKGNWIMVNLDPNDFEIKRK